MLSASRSKAMVLVVENDAISRELLAQLFRTGGFDVVAASTGAQALLMLCQHGPEIDWLVSKVGLSGLINGWLLADEYHQHHPDRPVLLLQQESEAAEMHSAQAIFVPSADLMKALETLKALRDPEPECAVSPRSAQAA